MPMTISSRIDCQEVNPRSGKRVDLVARRRRRARPICSECLRRPARAPLHGRWVALEGHDVCPQCWRARMDAQAALHTRAPRRRTP